MNVLVVDDELGARQALSRILKSCSDVVVEATGSLSQARELIKKRTFEVAFVDLKLGDDPANCDGLLLVAELRTQHQTATVVVSGWGDMENIRAAMRQGAYAFVVKDELREELVAPILEELRRRTALEREVTSLRARSRTDLPELVGTSSAMQRLRTAINRVALSDRPVLVTGPTGSGKELVVSAIHALGKNPGQPLLDLNCGALPAALIESQLFGHERGAFTGADRAHEGFFTAVGEGSLFLDEIAELPLDLQAKLLRVMESGTYRPVGSQKSLRFRGRILAATHADLQQRVQEQRFRQDLYYRIAVLEIAVPGLDERRDDVSQLVAHFIARQQLPLRFSADALTYLRNAPWPGNVRQLRNLIDRVSVFAEDTAVDLPALQSMLTTQRSSPNALQQLARAVLDMDSDTDKLRLAEQVLISEALMRCDGNKTLAARALGVHRKVIERRLGREPNSGVEGEPSQPE